MKKIKEKILFATLLLASVSSQAGMTLCQKYSCQKMDSYVPQEMLNAMTQMFMSGEKELLFCMSDKETRKCSGKPLSFSARTNLMYVDLQIPFARISNIQKQRGVIQMSLDYQIKANQYYPTCVAPRSSLAFNVSKGGDFQLSSPPFSCRMTELGETKMSLSFSLDFVDLDTGRLGGTYQTSVQGDLLGGGTGYALLRLTDQRVVELPRLTPTEFVSEDGYHLNIDKNGIHQGYRKNNQLVDWDWDNIKEKWNNFKEKFLKILYLEPLE